jgi:formylglycine-generating enzyme required for sulfatase activity
MSGNVWEWTRSLYRRYPYDAADGRENLNVRGSRAVRGGAFNFSGKRVRVAYRSYHDPDFRDAYVGFRAVLSRF